MRVLVTGGQGFIGSALISYLVSSKLDEHFELHCWNRRIHGSLLSDERRSNLLNQIQPEAVLHLAWHPTGATQYEMVQAHHDWAQASIRFASECRSRDIWFLCAGSGIDASLDGATSHLDNSAYLKAKRQLRKSFFELSNSYSDITWLGLQYVFCLRNLRPRIVRDLLQSSSPADFQPNRPSVRHDFIHIDDVASAISCVLTNSVNGDVPIGSGLSITTQDFAETVKFQVGYRKNRPLVKGQFPSDSHKQLNKLGWIPNSTYRFLGLEIEEQYNG